MKTAHIVSGIYTDLRRVLPLVRISPESDDRDPHSRIGRKVPAMLYRDLIDTGEREITRARLLCEAARTAILRWPLIRGASDEDPNPPAVGYWRHSITGEIWACQTVYGRLLSCAGPFTADTADEILLSYLDYDSREIGMLTAKWRFFVPYVRCRVCGKSINTDEAAHGTGGAVFHAACAPHS